MKNVPTESDKTKAAVTEATSAGTSSTGHSVTTTKDQQSSEDYDVGHVNLISIYMSFTNYIYRTNTTIPILTTIWTLKQC